jgi:hypothetical protein
MKEYDDRNRWFCSLLIFVLYPKSDPLILLVLTTNLRNELTLNLETMAASGLLNFKDCWTCIGPITSYIIKQLMENELQLQGQRIWHLQLTVFLFVTRRCAFRTQNPILTSNIEEEGYKKFKEALLNQHSSWKWQQGTEETLLLVDPPADIISIPAISRYRALSENCVAILSRSIITILLKGETKH